MALPQHPSRMLLAAVALTAALGAHGRVSPISDLKSQISGVEELLEEFRQQLQQEQAYKPGGVADSCLGDFDSVGESIIQTKASIVQGAAFLLAPDRVHTWKDCLRACCAQPHCTVAVVQQRHPAESLGCFLFNCTYRNRRVCSFAPQPGFSAYSRGDNTSRGPPPAPVGGGDPKSPAEGRPDEEEVRGEA